MNAMALDIALWGVRISAAFAMVFAVVVAVYAWLPGTESARPSRTPRPKIQYTSTHPRGINAAVAYGFAMLATLWIWAEVRASRKVPRDRVIEIQAVASNEIDAAYAAAQEPQKVVKSGNDRGYVYLGQCDTQWIKPKFGKLPPCKSILPEGGVAIISWKGDVIRGSIPVKINGKTKWGDEVSRVSAGYSVVLRKFVPVSVFQTGPQYYWGLVDFPTENPPDR